MAPLRPGLTPVRRAVGLAAVLFILGCAVVFYRLAPDLPTSGSSPRTTANSSASSAPTSVGTQSATAGGESPNADPSRASDRSTTTTTPGANVSTGSGSNQQVIQVDGSLFSAKPFQTVRIQGTYAAGADTFVQVQRLEEGTWLAFPLPAKTDQSGRFTLYVELAQTGRYRLRVLDPVSGRTSNPFVLVIKG
jgi:hypothetical protein